MSRFEQPTSDPWGTRLYGTAATQPPATQTETHATHPSESTTRESVGRKRRKPHVEALRWLFYKSDTRDKIAGLRGASDNRLRFSRQGRIHLDESRVNESRTR